MTQEAATVTSAPRRRRRAAAPGANTRNNTSDGRLERLYAAKVASDEATATYKAMQAEFREHLEKEKKTEHTLPAAGDRPAVTAKLMTRETTTIDPAKYRKVVDEAEFMASIKVGVTDAKKYLGTSQIEKISQKSKSLPFLDVRVLGARRK